LSIDETTRLITTRSEVNANLLLKTGWTLLLVADRREGEYQWFDYQLCWQHPEEPPEIRFTGVGLTQGRVRATTYASLVDTANLRLMRLRKTLAERYDNFPIDKLLNKVLSISEQHELGLSGAAVANDPLAVAS
jgi:hypothetical protein